MAADGTDASFLDLLVTHGVTSTCERMPVLAGDSTLDLYRRIETAACARLGEHVAVQLCANGRRIVADYTLLSSLGTRVISCVLLTRARLERCEPLWGPEQGGTSINVHGCGFHGVGDSARLRFGSVVVACERINDCTLRCRAPPHPTGIVRVTLMRCEDDDSDDDTASFNYVRLEAAYDTIFATTNSFCPTRHIGAKSGDADVRESTRR